LSEQTTPLKDNWVLLMPVVFVLIWSTGFVAAKLGMPNSPPFTFLFFRYVFSIVLFLPWIIASRVPWPSSNMQMLHISVTGVLMHAGYLGGVWAAVKAGMGSGLAALIVGLQPVLTAIWLSYRGGRIQGRQWLGLLVGFVGLILVLWNKLQLTLEISSETLPFIVIALFSITTGTLYQKSFVKPCDVRTANTVQLLAAALVTMPLAWMETESFVINSHSVIAMSWSVVVLTIGGSSLLYMLIQRGAAQSVTSLMYMVPPTTAIMAWLLFDEVITLVTILGVATTAWGVHLAISVDATKTKED
jgi:drug/metabolite transporter (DMT)-like permease